MAHDGGASLLLNQLDNDHFDLTTQQKAQEIVEVLGGLALAIDQANTYLKYKKMELTNFLHEYQTRKNEVLSFTPGKIWEYCKSDGQRDQALTAYTTWQMSFDLVERENPERKQWVADFLVVSSYFDPFRISEELFSIYWAKAKIPFPWLSLFSEVAHSKHDFEAELDNSCTSKRPRLPQRLLPPYSTRRESLPKVEEPRRIKRKLPREAHHQTREWKSDRFWQVIMDLHQVSLIQSVQPASSANSAYFSIHPLIRDWLQLKGDGKQQEKSFSEAIDLISRVSHYDLLGLSLNFRLEVLTHMDSCMASQHLLPPPLILGNRKTGKQTMAFIHLYSKQFRYKQARQMLEAMVDSFSLHTDLNSKDRIWCIEELAVIYRSKGRFNKAEQCQIQVVEAVSRQYGSNSLEAAKCTVGLARIWTRQGHYRNAERVFFKTLSKFKEELGSEHVKTYNLLHYIGSLYMEQYRWNEAEEIFERILSISQLNENVMIPTMRDLAYVYTYDGKNRFEKAEKLLQRVSEHTQQKYGEDIRTACTMADLGVLHWRQGRYEEAEDLLHRALELQRRTMGVNRNIFPTMLNLSDTFISQFRWKAAEKLQMEALRIGQRGMKQAYLTKEAMLDLGKTHAQLNRWEELEDGMKELLRCVSFENDRDLSILKEMESLTQRLRHERPSEASEQLHAETIDKLRALGTYTISQRMSLICYTNKFQKRGSCSNVRRCLAL